MRLGRYSASGQTVRCGSTAGARGISSTPPGSSSPRDSFTATNSRACSARWGQPCRSTPSGRWRTACRSDRFRYSTLPATHGTTWCTCTGQKVWPSSATLPGIGFRRRASSCRRRCHPSSTRRRPACSNRSDRARGSHRVVPTHFGPLRLRRELSSGGTGEASPVARAGPDAAQDALSYMLSNPRSRKSAIPAPRPRTESRRRRDPTPGSVPRRYWDQNVAA